MSAWAQLVSLHVLTSIARGYAACGLAVFPTRGKQPVASAAPHGFWDASTDETAVARMFERAGAAATGIGCAVGLSRLATAPHGLLVVDCDGDEGVAAWRALGDWPETLTARTPGKRRADGTHTGPGLHVYFRTDDPRARSTKEGTLAASVGTRRDGCYTVVPPSAHPHGGHYGWEDAPIATAPERLLELLAATHQPALSRAAPPALLPSLTSRGERDRAWGEAALAGLADELLAAREGTRNTTLNAVAYRAGRLEGGGFLLPGHAETVLLAVCAQVFHANEQREAGHTTHRAIRDGLAQPTERRSRND